MRSTATGSPSSSTGQRDVDVDDATLRRRALALLDDYGFFWAETILYVETGSDLDDILMRNALLDPAVVDVSAELIEFLDEVRDPPASAQPGGSV